MNISVYLTHPSVDCWNFKEKQRLALASAIPDSHIEVSTTKEAFIRSLASAQIALIWNFQQEWFDSAPNLEWIVTPAAGKDFFNVMPPQKVSIDYCSFHGELIGETVLGMILSCTRGIRDAFELQQMDPWPRTQIEKNMRPLRGSHLVILGFGNIGRWIGRLAKPFGVRITGVKRTHADPPDYFGDEDRIIAISGLENVLPETDHLAIALPGGNETLDIIDGRKIGLLPKHAMIYNVGRGNAIDENALVEALRTEKIAGAFLDVFKEEPLPAQSPLLKCPHITLMPHASAIAPNYLELFIQEFISKYKKRYSGKAR
jgi:D-2-hydroxyacid dehydrogenase (NADP+)